MKILCLLLSLTIASIISFSQSVAINASGDAADKSAILDVSSKEKGILVPRLRTSERKSITDPANGLLVYDVDSKSFWYSESGNWKEIMVSGGAALPVGPAGGDLSGSFPTPTVAKIQNLDIAPGVPFDMQVLKWDQLNNTWRAMNDSLQLPYNATFGSPVKLFGITNTNNTNGATAVYGKSGNTGSGVAPAVTIGVWGDNSSGAGVAGTSSNNTGVFGYSVQQNGVYGFTAGLNAAGIYGSNANAGVGVMGELFNGGKAIYGRSAGLQGTAGVFENTNDANTAASVVIMNAGLGAGINLSLPSMAGTGDGLNIPVSGAGNAISAITGTGSAADFKTTNANAVKAMIAGNNEGKGAGFTLLQSSALNAANAIEVNHSGTGTGIYSKVTTGRALWLENTNISTINELLFANNLGKGNAGKFSTNNASNNNATVLVTTNGTGRALESNISNAASVAAAVYASSAGAKGVEAIAYTSGITGQTTSFTGGIGVFGQSSLNSNDGIGVKGVSYSGVTTSGAVTGINNGAGVAVYAESTLGNAVIGKTSKTLGAAIYGINDASQGQALRGTATGADGISVYGEAGISNSTSIAAYFRNFNLANNKNVLQVITNGTGRGVSIESTNSGNNTDLVYGKNAGTGNFLYFLDASLAEKLVVNGSGNVTASGTVTVKNNKGIVRNTTSTQLRTEILTASIPAGDISHYDQFNSAVAVNLTFTTAFSSAPTVIIGNYTSGGILGLTAVIENVTTTGCKFVLRNYTQSDFTFNATTCKVLAIGAE